MHIGALNVVNLEKIHNHLICVATGRMESVPLEREFYYFTIQEVPSLP